MLARAFREYKSLPMGQNPPVFCTAGGCASPARPFPTPNQLLKLALRCLRTPGLLFLFERLTLDSHIREAPKSQAATGAEAFRALWWTGGGRPKFVALAGADVAQKNPWGQNWIPQARPQTRSIRNTYASTCKQSSSGFKAQPSNVPQRASRSHAPQRQQTGLRGSSE